MIMRDNEENMDQDTSKCQNLPIFGTRHMQILMLFFGVGIIFTMRVNLSVGIVAMTNQNHTNPDFKTFDWESSTKQTIISSFVWGYIASQIVGSQMSKRFGAKYVIAISMFFSAALTLLTPTLTLLWDWEALLVLRILTGISQGCFFPSLATFISKWIPKRDLARSAVFIVSGVMVGTFLIIASSGQIALSLGWPYIFYMPSICGFLWIAVWVIFSASSPAQHRRISELEKKFIQDSLGHSENSHKTYIPVPWLQIFTSVPFYALLLADCCNAWAFQLLLTESPMYIDAIFDVGINKNAILSALPYLARVIMEYVLIGIEYLIQKKELMTMQRSRNFFTIIGLCIPALCIGVFSFIPANFIYLSILILIISNAANAALGLGSNMAILDIAPNHAETLMGISNIASGFLTNFAPLLVGAVVTNVHDQSQWQIIFVMTSVLLVIGCIGYLIFGSNEVQDWNDMSKISNKKNENNGQAPEKYSSMEKFN